MLRSDGELDLHIGVALASMRRFRFDSAFVSTRRRERPASGAPSGMSAAPARRGGGPMPVPLDTPSRHQTIASSEPRRRIGDGPRGSIAWANLHFLVGASETTV